MSVFLNPDTCANCWHVHGLPLEDRWADWCNDNLCACRKFKSARAQNRALLTDTPADFIHSTLKALGAARRHMVEGDLFCVPEPIGCGQAIRGFHDPLSLEEFYISGLCQECQDNFFE